jgi:hypothetical protein
MPADDFQMLRTELRNWPTLPRFWWRDDDIRQDSPNFRRLLEWSKRIDAMGLLGVIPGRIEPGVPDLLAAHPSLRLGQHGWMHRNYEPEGQPKSEFGHIREPDAVLDDLRCGYQRMEELFGASFLPVFVPPWNNFGLHHTKLLETAGFHGLSCKDGWRSIHGGLERVDAHIDLVLYGKKRPAARTPEGLQAKLVKLLAKMRQHGVTSENPIGILTHHGAVFDDRGWALLADLVEVTRRHGCTWVDPNTLFSEKSPPSSKKLGWTLAALRRH